MNEANKTTALFWRKMGVMIDASLPLMKALATVVKEIPERDPLRNVICGVAAAIESGSTLKEALARYPEAFPPTVLALAEVGEMTGAIEQSMFKIADGYDNGTFSAGEMPGQGTCAQYAAPAADAAENDDAAVKYVKMVIGEAVKSRASDIHFEWVNGNMRVRRRIDGVLHGMEAPPVPIQASVIRRLKIMGAMNVAERRVPQDGRIQLNVSGADLDCRVSAVPCVTGESISIRILNKQPVLPGLDRAGFSPENLEKIAGWLKQPGGMIVTAGPAGSGKTTLLYTCLKELNSDGVKIVTVEDPVEYVIAGVNQVAVRQELGLTFPGALQGMLRQDPDVFMIGEMRDMDTLSIGVNAALTGRLVLTSLYANEAPAAVMRMIEMGLDPFFVSSALLGVCAQRLVRRICPECREEYKPEPRLVELAKAGPGMKFFRGKGCPACNQTGYLGRIAIHEMLGINDRIRSVLAHDCDLAALRKAARDTGMMTLREDGLAKVKQGITTIDELLRIAV